MSVESVPPPACHACVKLLNYDDIEALTCEGRRAALKRAFEMHEYTYRFFALGSDCAIRIFAGQKQSLTKPRRQPRTKSRE